MNLSQLRSLKKITAAILLVALGACTPKSESPTAKTLKIGYPISGAIINSQLGLLLEGWAGKNNLTVHRFNTGRELKVALAAGQVDVILTSEANFLMLLGEKYPAVAIGSLGSAGNMALVVKKGSPYKTVESLAGKKVAAIFGTSVHQPASEWTKNLNPPAELVNISQPPALRSALQAGEVAAIVDWDPYLTEGLAQHQIEILKQSSFDLITVTNRTLVSEHLSRLKELNELFKKGMLEIALNPTPINNKWADISKMSADVIDRASKSNANYTAKSSKNIHIEITPALKEKLKKSAEFLVSEKILNEPLTFDGAYADLETK